MSWEGLVEKVLKEANNRIRSTRLPYKPLSKKESLNVAQDIFF
jgi:hypothetical protein